MIKEKDDICDIYVCDPVKIKRQKAVLSRTAGLAGLFKMLADDTRVKIIYALSQEEELCVCEVATIIDSSIATASHHLRLLRNAGMAKYRKEGKMAYYSLENPHLEYIIKEALKIKKEEGTTNE